MEPSASKPDVTELLLAWSKGDQSALQRLMPIVYRELKRLARRYMLQERGGHTLQPTALMNEAYLRLSDINRMHWQNRAHFFAVSAQMMRRILVEHARRRNRQKRGDGARGVEIDQVLTIVAVDGESNVLAINDALDALGTVDPRWSRIVELRFFGGLTVEETAEVLKVSEDTVTRDWKKAKAWLLRYLIENR
jgi:RNA polymerase sigma-70 factor (ECF subfamily)